MTPVAESSLHPAEAATVVQDLAIGAQLQSLTCPSHHRSSNRGPKGHGRVDPGLLSCSSSVGNRIDTFHVTTKPCSVCVLCAVFLGGMYPQYFCSGVSMVIAVHVGDIWELPRLSCRRRHILGTCQDTGGSAGRRGTTTLYCPHTRCGGGFRRGGVAGAEPPHKGGPQARPPRKTRREVRGVRNPFSLSHRRLWARTLQLPFHSVLDGDVLYSCWLRKEMEGHPL